MVNRTDDSENQSDSAVKVARVSSPSTNTELTLDIIEPAENRRLVGALVGLSWEQSEAQSTGGGSRTAVLGQITSIEMRNRWHEEQTFKNIVKTRGELPAITKLQDTRTATMKVGGCFVRGSSGEYAHGDLGSVPSTGGEINLVRQQFLDSVLASCRGDLFYLGMDYAGNIKFPMWFKHFGTGDGGIGEAYHMGIFGKTGSGKTGLAKMLLAAYARHPQMGILVIDPQGEFSLEMKGSNVGGQELELEQLIESKLGREVRTLAIEDLQLDDWGLMAELLGDSGLIDRELGIRGHENAEAAVNAVIEHLKEGGFEGIASRRRALAAVHHLRKTAGDVYSTPARIEQLKSRIDELVKSVDAGRSGFARRWEPLMSMFEPGKGKLRVEVLVNRLLSGRYTGKPVVVLNLSGTPQHARYVDSLQKRIISHISNAIVEESAKTLGTDRTANTLIVLDEAHRFAPSGGMSQLDPNDQRLREELKRAVRETRKYGVGWMFISQTMMGLDTELLMQLRTMFFGYGLSFGLEFQRLRELAGGDQDAMELYRSFRDPQSAMDAGSKRFPFMAIGPISPMPFSGQPMFFSAFNGREFVDANFESVT